MPEVLPILCGALFTLAAGYSLGSLLFSRPSLPHAIRLAAGSAILSHLIFLLLLARAGRWEVFLAVGAALIGAAALKKRWTWPSKPELPCLPAAVFAFYGAYYLVHALAPEIRPDGYTYHLGLPAEWLRLGGFPGRVGFYEMLPQGMEMLFTFAFAFGKHSAAKLVHFAMLAASVPLLLGIGRRLALPASAATAGAGLYFSAPVVGAAGTAAYNDAALVFFVLAAFYLLLAWWQEGQDAYLLPLGLAAGFCYAIKPTGLIVAPVVVAVVAARRHWKGAAVVALASAAMIAPWMIRNAVLAGNPLAPLMNRLFPNPHFHISTEEQLAKSLRSYEGVTWSKLPWEVTVRGSRLQGLTGPVFLLAPLALAALRRTAGRWLLAAAALLAIPWLLNIGTRFLMPSLAFVALALAATLPRRLALSCLALQAVLSLPPVVAAYADPGAWRLEGWPWRAALRIEPERDYLRRRLGEFRVAELIQEHVPPRGRVLDLLGAPTAYFDAEAVTPWHSAAGDRLGYALQISLVTEPGVFSEIECRWPERELTAIRFARTQAGEAQWGISEVQLFLGQEQLELRPGWRFLARPNVWEARFAFDRNWMSRWGTWEPAEPGMHLGVDFRGPVRIDRARLICLTHEQQGPVEFHGRSLEGAWEALAGGPVTRRLPSLNLRLSAMRLVRQEGIGFILAPAGQTGYGPAGEALSKHPADWGLELLGQAGHVFLFRLK